MVASTASEVPRKIECKKRGAHCDEKFDAGTEGKG